MNIKISFNDTPPAQAIDLDTLREQQDQARRRRELELALAALGKGDLDTVKQWVKRMEEDYGRQS